MTIKTVLIASFLILFYDNFTYAGLFSSKKRTEKKLEKNSMIISTGQEQNNPANNISTEFPLTPPLPQTRIPEAKPATIINQKKTNELILNSEQKINTSLSNFDQSIRRLALFMLQSSQKKQKDQFVESSQSVILKKNTIDNISVEVNEILSKIKIISVEQINFFENQKAIRKKYNVQIQYELSKLTSNSADALNELKILAEETLRSYMLTTATIKNSRTLLPGLSGPTNDYSIFVLRDIKRRVSELREVLKGNNLEIKKVQLKEVELNQFIRELSQYK